MTLLKTNRLLFLFLLFSLKPIQAAERPPIILYAGYVTQVHCKGKLFLSSVGNEKIVTLQALPKELDCGVIIVPEAESGRTNLIIKTSTGDSNRILEIRKPTLPIPSSALEIWLEELADGVPS